MGLEKDCVDAEFKGNYLRIFQGGSKFYAEFLGETDRCISEAGDWKETQHHLISQLAFKNANEIFLVIFYHIRNREREIMLRGT